VILPVKFLYCDNNNLKFLLCTLKLLSFSQSLNEILFWVLYFTEICKTWSWNGWLQSYYFQETILWKKISLTCKLKIQVMYRQKISVYFVFLKPNIKDRLQVDSSLPLFIIPSPVLCNCSWNLILSFFFSPWDCFQGRGFQLQFQQTHVPKKRQSTSKWWI